MSAALAVSDALVTALRADAPVQAFLGGVPGATKVYTGLADDPNALPYITLPETRETPGGLGQTFGQRGSIDDETLHLWARTKREVLELYGLVEAALSGIDLALDGHALIRGTTTLVRAMPDQDGQAHHGIVRYRAHTRVTG